MILISDTLFAVVEGLEDSANSVGRKQRLNPVENSLFSNGCGVELKILGGTSSRA
ncbi:MAG: hypothetical protein LC734_02000 [Acidobacteria bacterium]|nr:hypothetical protein [Acidobacteriota bacterium]